MKKSVFAAGALAGLVLVGAGVGTLSAQSAATATGLTEEQVIEIALAEVPGEVQEVELERKRGVQFYEVEIVAEDGTEMEVEIAADTGDVLKVKEDKEDGDRKGRKGGCDKDDDGDDQDDDQTEAEGEDA